MPAGVHHANGHIRLFIGKPRQVGFGANDGERLLVDQQCRRVSTQSCAGSPPSDSIRRRAPRRESISAQGIFVLCSLRDCNISACRRSRPAMKFAGEILPCGASQARPCRMRRSGPTRVRAAAPGCAQPLAHPETWMVIEPSSNDFAACGYAWGQPARRQRCRCAGRRTGAGDDMAAHIVGPYHPSIGSRDGRRTPRQRRGSGR